MNREDRYSYISTIPPLGIAYNVKARFPIALKVIYILIYLFGNLSYKLLTLIVY